jgi:urease beta subunit
MEGINADLYIKAPSSSQLVLMVRVNLFLTFTIHNVNCGGAQIGPHYYFIETNARLSFECAGAYGKRLGIPAGTVARFEPGEIKTITLLRHHR